MDQEALAVSSTRSQGVAMADYDVASFHVSVSEKANNSAFAKTLLKSSVDLVVKKLEELKEKGLTYREGSYKTSSFVGPDYEYNKKTGGHEVVGRKATWTVSFQTSNMEMVNEVYDVLSSLELNDIQVSSPAFKIDNLKPLHKEALKNAWNNVKERFASECEILGLKPEHYEILTWNVHYDERERAMPQAAPVMAVMSFAADSSEEDDFLDLNSGKAVVHATLTVQWKRW